MSDIQSSLKYERNKYYLDDITGAKVKVNIERIADRGPVSTRFREFLNYAKDKEFTAKLDVDNGYTKMYVLEEDPSEIQWLFHIEDLILVE